MRMKTLALLAASLLLLGAAPSVGAAEYYLSPSGSAGNPGTRAEPLNSLAAVASSSRTFAPGDILILLAGHHGSPVLRTQNSGVVTVRADSSARVTVKQLSLQNARNWRVIGLEVSPEFEAPYTKVTMITISGGSDNVVEDCLAYSIADASRWAAADWDTLSCNGASVSGTRNTIRGSHFKNVNFGINVSGSGTDCLIDGNTVENFAGDGLRGLGNNCTFQYNLIKNCYKVNTNHDDGFQSWSNGSGGVGTGVVRGVVVRGNTFISYTDPAQPLRGNIQGIGCFDGFFEDWVVENNVIFTNAWHGIAFYGARNCRIVNNTVFDLDTGNGVPWIKVTAHKTGSASTGNLVRNNLVSDLQIDAGTSMVDHNIESTNYSALFANWAGRDLRLKAGSPAIDAGIDTLAPVIDRNGTARPLDGNGDGLERWDVGAYEYGSSSAILPAAPTDLRME